jgi:hypothetical protein
MRSTFHREDPSDVTDVHLFLLGFRLESNGFTSQMALAVGTVLASSPYTFMHWCSWSSFVT